MIYCSNCRFFVPNTESFPSDKTSAVKFARCAACPGKPDGYALIDSRFEPPDNFCNVARSIESMCGAEAKLFQSAALASGAEEPSDAPG